LNVARNERLIPKCIGSVKKLLFRIPKLKQVSPYDTLEFLSDITSECPALLNLAKCASKPTACLTGNESGRKNVSKFGFHRSHRVILASSFEPKSILARKCQPTSPLDPLGLPTRSCKDKIIFAKGIPVRQYQFIQLDVFTDVPLCGNALAVFPEAEGITDEEMQKIAREMNLSETVFVLKPKDANTADEAQQKSASEEKGSPGPGASVLRRLRIFTPTREIPFAGHPVVGTWNALAREGVVTPPENGTGWTRIHHEIGIGVLPVDIEFKDGEPVQVVMTQGNLDLRAVIEDSHERADLARALGLATEDLDENLPIQVISTGLPFLAVPVRSLADLARCRVNAQPLVEIYKGIGGTGCCAFSRETIEVGEARAHMRMFAPDDNIPEDPATGSAAGALGSYLVHYGAANVEPADGKYRFVIEQGDFINRPSRINLEVTGAAGAVKQVRVGGPSVIVARGELFL
jgi:trans-2,3-dihydro-3-hydroxyanthranilate isomerase